jgi:hypothetical protein
MEGSAQENCRRKGGDRRIVPRTIGGELAKLSGQTKHIADHLANHLANHLAYHCRLCEEGGVFKCATMREMRVP